MKVLLGLLLAIGCGSTFAQAPNPYDGKWKATWSSEARQYEALVVINGSGGTWKTFSMSQSKSNLCLGKESPIHVTTASPEALVFTGALSEVIKGCADFTVRLKPDGAGLKGTRGAFPVELVRN